MKRLCSTVTILLAALMPMWAQQPGAGTPPGRIVTTTRLVTMFHDLELRLITAAHGNDRATLDRLLAPDFEVWTPEPPGQPLPRAAWMDNLKKPGAPGSVSLRQMAVKGLDDHAVASFVLLEGAHGTESAHFIVDVWTHGGNEWKLTDRYQIPVPAAAYAAERKPSGKN